VNLLISLLNQRKMGVITMKKLPVILIAAAVFISFALIPCLAAPAGADGCENGVCFCTCEPCGCVREWDCGGCAITPAAFYQCKCTAVLSCGDEGYPYGPDARSFHTGNCGMMIGSTGNGGGRHGIPCGKSAVFPVKCEKDGMELTPESYSCPGHAADCTCVCACVCTCGDVVIDEDVVEDEVIEEEEEIVEEEDGVIEEEIAEEEEDVLGIEDGAVEEEEVFDIEDEQVPLAGPEDETEDAAVEEEEEIFDIVDEDVPLGEIPKTGSNRLFALGFGLAASVTAAAGAACKRGNG
jgi:hypothetical protein